MDQEKIVHYYEMYSDTVYRIGFSYLKNKNDADDVVQETFLRLVKQNGGFESDEHVKAWLIVTAANFCKSLLGHWWNKRADLEDTEIPVEAEYGNRELLEAIWKLPPNVRVSIYLFYYEGYSSKEIAKMLRKPDGTIRSYLHQGREKLKDQLQEGL